MYFFLSFPIALVITYAITDTVPIKFFMAYTAVWAIATLLVAARRKMPDVQKATIAIISGFFGGSIASMVIFALQTQVADFMFIYALFALVIAAVHKWLGASRAKTLVMGAASAMAFIAALNLNLALTGDLPIERCVDASHYGSLAFFICVNALPKRRMR